RFSADIEFPAPGLYHIYTDAVPSGIGQQVMRFDVAFGEVAADKDAPRPAAADILEGPIVSSDGPYRVTLDASHLQPGVESMVSLLVEKDGAPARDIEPYLGVSAHAVFIRTEDLAYVHAHAMDAGADGGHHAQGSAPSAPPSPPAGHDHSAATESAGHGDQKAPDEGSGHDAHNA